jgi:protein-S-isoprenylcysteine O-methyltransferase Ste14
MYHDATLAQRTTAARPPSAVGHGVGLAGLAGLAAWTTLARALGMDGAWAGLANVVACGLPMVLWSLLVDRVHRSPSTGIDWSAPHSWRESREVSLVKLAGLWATWGLMALIYATGRFWWEGRFLFAMELFTVLAPVLLVASVPYVLWLDRYLVEPRDGAWALGAWLTGQAGWDADAIGGHLRAWAVKGFFLPFMVAVVPGGFVDFVRWDFSGAWSDPVRLANGLVTLMFVVDVAFATVGYLLTLRPLDAHIRSANPYAAAWAAALICYPPSILMADGGPLDYHPGTQEWSAWFAGHPVLLWAIGAALVALTAIYAWATVAFGLRFSNLTHRGILTHGPYAWSRHPAYLSKNLFWWLATVPVLSTGSWLDAARATLLLGCVSGVYWWRAKTEERHLSADTAYRAYRDWAEAHAPVPRLLRWLRG